MAERDFRDSVGCRKLVEYPATKARAGTAKCFALRHYALYNAVRITLDHVVLNTEFLEIGWQYVLREIRLLLVEIDRNELELHRCFRLQAEQDIEHRVRVLAAGQAHHHPVAGFDHAEIRDRATDIAPQSLLQLVEIDRLSGFRHCGEDSASSSANKVRCGNCLR